MRLVEIRAQMWLNTDGVERVGPADDNPKHTVIAMISGKCYRLQVPPPDVIDILCGVSGPTTDDIA